MNNLEKYKQTFIESFEIDESLLEKDLDYNAIAEWDSVGHMTLMANLEDVFEILLETDDIIEFSSYQKGIEIIKKYKVQM